MSLPTASLRSLSELPDCIVGDILSRVSLKTIFICRSVCKTWLDLISDPFFSTLHAKSSQPSTVMLLTLGNPWKLSFVDLDKPRIRCNKRVLSQPDPVVVHGSCHGLFLLRHNISRALFIYNPNLNEYDVLDDHVNGPDTETLGMGIGYSANKYKVVKFIYTPSSGVTEAKVCVFGNKTKTSWKNIIDKIPFEGKPSFMSHCGVWHSGDIYWFVLKPLGLGFICCFNVESEQFRVISVPDRLTLLEFYTSYVVRLGVLRDRLYVTYGFPYRSCEVRFLEDSGWSNMFLVSEYSSSLHLLHKWPSGKILFANHGNLFLYHNLTTTKLEKDGKRSYGESYAYVPSLISPKKLLGKIYPEKKQYQNTTTAHAKTEIPSAAVLPWIFWLRKLVPICWVQTLDRVWQNKEDKATKRKVSMSMS